MKKLLSLMILLSAGTAYSTETSKQKAYKIISTTTKLSADAETVENKQPSFLVRHADKLKTLSYITSIPPILLLAIMTSLPQDKIISIKQKQSSSKSIQSEKIMAITILFKFITDVLTLYAMNSKNAYLQQNLKKYQNNKETVPK